MSLDLTKQQSDDTLTIFLKGRLDTTTAPELECFLTKELENTSNLELDMSDLEYISSAGLRVLLGTQKFMNKKGSMKLLHVQENVMEIFEITGFVDILTIE